MSDFKDWIDENDDMSRGEDPEGRSPDFSGGWNYRVVRRQGPDGPVFGIHEVYYNGEDEPRSCTKKPVGPMSDDVEELMKEIDRMKQALDKPVLDYEEFG